MLAKANRLTRQKDFDKVFATGKSFYDKLLGIRALAKAEEESRYGILVGNKISKKAVLRNKIKRQIRAILHNLLPGIKNGFDVVVITLPPVKEAEYEQIEKSLIFCLKKLKLWEKPERK